MIIGILSLCILLGLAAIAILNALTFPRLRPSAPSVKSVPSVDSPIISILVPARNEAAVIEHTLAGLHAQNHPGLLEIVVLDDHSSDATAEIVRRWERRDGRIRLVAGEELPAGWTGKNWACAQLAGQARGDLLIFTDADVTWRAGALEGALAVMQHTQADMLTVWPTQHTETWAERLVVPMMMFVLLAYLPELGVRRLPFASLSAANGQMVAFRRETYRHIGGHHAVAGEIVEDVALARRTKQMGRRLVMALGNGLIIGRMYHNWPEARDGFAKNILAGHGGSPLALLASGVFHTGLFLWPWAWLALGALRPSAGWPGMPLAMLALGILLRALTAAVSGGRVGDALLLPISNLLFWIIALRSLAWHFGRGGPLWKGRWINTPLSS